MASSQSLLEPGVELEPVECFITEAIRNDLARAPGSRVATRFPPEPNGHLHLGHAKSIVLNFGLAHQFGGTCCLRFDDTNPAKETQAFVDGAVADVRWLGFRPTAVTHASAYMAQLYALALELIRAGLAFVDDESEETIRQKRGGLHRPGEASAFRERDVATNLRLFEDMRAGRCRDGERVLRAKIDMQSSNMLLRDPVLYRVRHVRHHRLDDAWCVFPTYDFAHGQCDSFERISHSLCTLEFAEHRPLYEWLQQKLALPRSQQIEFARLNLAFTCLSKRVLAQLVQESVVAGWDDPRMPTLCGLRRRGVPAAALRAFLLQQGVTRRDTLTKQQVFLKAVLEHLKDAPHAFAILEPLQMRLLNFDQHFRGQEHVEVTYRSASESCARKQRIYADLIIDRQDFQEAPDEAWRRLAPGRVVRLKG
uniref:glutamine--tRNA ligase n=1 Tax=Dermatophagoides pteronyssinus TaxID=6956 RepID=A0A6P6Y7A4_DERPT